MKQWQNIAHVILNANSILQHVIQNKNGIIKYVNVNVRIILNAKKDYSWNPSPCTYEKSKYLKSIADTSVSKYDEIISVMDIVSTKKTDTIATNITKSCHSKKVIDCYILETVLLGIILLLIIVIICYH